MPTRVPRTSLAQPGSDDKSAVMKEIDRRYHAATGTDSGQIKPGETANQALWSSIRDEVLFQHQYIANLPESVKQLIRFSTKGRQLTPADYDQLFRIAKKIAGMPQGQAADYASKATASTTDLGAFEASLDRDVAEMTTRTKDSEQHNQTMTKLSGLVDVYKQYRVWQAIEDVAPGAGKDLKTEIEAALKVHGFTGGIPEFDTYVKKFLSGFESEAAKVVTDLLKKYAGRMYREGERYQDPKEVSALHGKLGGVRASHAIVDDKNKIMNEEYHKQDAERDRARLPGNGGTTPEPTPRFKQAEKEALAARDAAKAEIKGLEHDHPLFQNDDALPIDKRIDKVALATASETSLQGVLLGYIAKRGEAIHEASDEVEGKPELIYRMDKLMPQFYARQGIQPGSIHELIIQEKLKEDRIKKIVTGIVFAIVAIALTVVSLGTATPALVAAGAAAGAFGISAYQAYEEYKEYNENHKLAGVGYVDDPSVIWLVVAVVGAAADMGAAAKAIKGLGAAAKALNTTGEISHFNKAVRALEEAGEIDARIARAAERAANARAGFAEASGELTKILAGPYVLVPRSIHGSRRLQAARQDGVVEVQGDRQQRSDLARGAQEGARRGQARRDVARGARQGQAGLGGRDQGGRRRRERARAGRGEGRRAQEVAVGRAAARQRGLGDRAWSCSISSTRLCCRSSRPPTLPSSIGSASCSSRTPPWPSAWPRRTTRTARSRRHRPSASSTPRCSPGGSAS